MCFLHSRQKDSFYLHKSKVISTWRKLNKSVAMVYIEHNNETMEN